MEKSSLVKYTCKCINNATLNQALMLLRNFFGRLYYGADDKYVRWQYFDSPFKITLAKKDDYSILVFLDEKENILALDAFLPWLTLVDGKEVVTAWDTEWINFSGIKGLGRELLEVLREKSNICCAYGLNAMSLPAYKKMGYLTKNEIERKIAILNAKKCIELFGNEEINKQKEFFVEAEVKANSDTKYCNIKSVEKISEKYWLGHIERFRVSSFKDIRALKWRYFDHPYIKYDLISLDTEAKTGLAVVRLEHIMGFEENVLRILELLPIKGYEKELVNAVLKFGFDKGAVLADFFCISQKYCNQICPAPFIPLSEYRRYEVPMLFQPIEVRERKSINMVLDCDVKYGAVSFDDFYATKGDAAQDIFVNADYKTVSL